MAKKRLSVEVDYNYFLIGICCFDKASKMAWTLGQALHCPFEVRKNYKATKSLSNNTIESYAYFSAIHEHYTFHLVANLSAENSYLIPEHKNVNYFFVITGIYKELELQDITKKIRAADRVLAALELDPSTLKSRDKLILD